VPVPPQLPPPAPLPPGDLPPGTPVELARTRRKRQARDWQLVLMAAGIPFVPQPVDGATVLAVPIELLERARRELELFEEENRGWPRAAELPEVLTEGSLAVAVWSLALIFLDQLARYGAGGHDWRAAGRSAASLVREGELWRTVTALTLHGGLFHLAGNVVFGALFVGLASQVLGTGLALAATLFAGALGNLANAWVQDPTHASIGASTAVFGALGVLVGYRARHRTHGRGVRWVPIAAGFMLLLWLGVGDPEPRPGETHRVDVFAHLLGFLAGGALGMLRAGAHAWRPGRRQQIALGLGAGALLALSWSLALQG
jgi:membrane associated rhomboid family serine protease